MPRTGVDALARFAAWAWADREAHRIADGGFGRKWVSRFKLCKLCLLNQFWSNILIVDESQSWLKLMWTGESRWELMWWTCCSDGVMGWWGEMMTGWSVIHDWWFYIRWDMYMIRLYDQVRYDQVILGWCKCMYAMLSHVHVIFRQIWLRFAILIPTAATKICCDIVSCGVLGYAIWARLSHP